MDYVSLGSTGLIVSRVGFGGIPIQRIDSEGTKAIFESLVENGVTYIDTARGYTVSEEYIGYAMESLGIRDKLVVATKSMARDKAGMAADIETSLRNLRTNYIDLYQIHNPSAEQLRTVFGEGGAMEALREAKETGKIGHIGLTAHGLDVFEKGIELDEIETIMFPYNIVETQGEELIKRCAERGKAFIAMKPMAGGAIEDGGIAMRFILSNPNVTVAIPGMYLVDEVIANASAKTSADVSADAYVLTASEVDRVNEVRSKLTGNFCRRCGYCAPCAVGINIPGVFLFHGYLERYGLENWSRSRYAGLSVKASACVNCGACEPRCPYNLPIRNMLEQAAKAFGE